MNILLRIKSRHIPAHLEERVGKEKIEKLFSMIEDGISVSDIIASGPIERSEVSALLPELIKAGLLAMAYQKTETRKQRPSASESETPKENRNGIVLVTDSTSDIPSDMAKERDIKVIPLSIKLDDKAYLDGADIGPDEFYDLLKKSYDFPSTSPPPESEFHKLFSEHIGDRDILGIFLSRKMSNTFDIANAAKMSNYNAYMKQRIRSSKNPRNFRIELIDSRLVSMGAGMLVIEASDKIREGWSIEKVRDHILSMIPGVRVLFIVNTLKYLVRGGRIGRGTAMMGKLFRFRPILAMTDGYVNAVARVRGGKKAQNQVVELIKTDLGDPRVPIKAGICHANAERWAMHMRDMVEKELNCKSLLFSHFGPTVGSHAGPGTVGIAYYKIPHRTGRFFK